MYLLLHPPYAGRGGRGGAQHKYFASPTPVVEYDSSSFRYCLHLEFMSLFIVSQQSNQQGGRESREAGEQSVGPAGATGRMNHLPCV